MASSPMGLGDVTLSPLTNVDSAATPFRVDDSLSRAVSTALPFRRPDDLVGNLVAMSQSLSPHDPLRAVFDSILSTVLAVQDLEASRAEAANTAAEVTSDSSQSFSAVMAAAGTVMSGRDSEVIRPQGQALVRSDIQVCQQGLKELGELEERISSCKVIDLDSAKVLSVMEENKRQIARCALACRQRMNDFVTSVETTTVDLHNTALAEISFARQQAQSQEKKFTERRDELALRTAQKVETMQTRLKGIAANCSDTNEVLLQKISRLDEYDDRVIDLEKQRLALKDQVGSLMTLLAEVNGLFRQCASVPCMEGKLRQATVRQAESQKLFTDLSQELERPSSPKTRPPPPPSPAGGPTVTPLVLGQSYTESIRPQQDAVLAPGQLRMSSNGPRPSARPSATAPASRPATSSRMPKRQRSPPAEQQFHPSAEADEAPSSGGFLGKVFGFVRRIAEHAAELPEIADGVDEEDQEGNDEEELDEWQESGRERSTKRLRAEQLQESSPQRQSQQANNMSSPPEFRQTGRVPTTAAGHAVAALAEARLNHIESMRQAVKQEHAATAHERNSEQLSPPRLSAGLANTAASAAFAVRPSPALRRTPFVVTSAQAEASPMSLSQQSDTDHGSQFGIRRVDSVEFLGSQPPRKTTEQ